MIELVIKIPKDEYQNILLTGKASFVLINAIEAGTILPKGHGDLIDRDDLLVDSYCIDDWAGNEVNIVDVMTVEMADVIIESDKSESEE